MDKACITRKMLAAKFCVSQDDHRAAVNKLRVSRTEVVATDGMVLLRLKNTCEQPEGDGGPILLNPEMIKLIEKVVPKGQPAKPGVVTLSGNGAEVTAEGQSKDGALVELQMNRLDAATFPNYEQLWGDPATQQHVCTINVKLMEKLLKAAKAYGLKSFQLHQHREFPNKPLTVIGDEGNFKGLIMPMRR